MQGFNKYYPPDFDPRQTQTLNGYRGVHALGKRAKDIDKGVLVVRFELPFNIWCGSCNAHLGAGVRYNAQKTKVGNYYSTPIYAFRCKCHLCSGWFEIRTDPQNARYVVHEGARAQIQDWDPEENGGFAVHDTEAPSATDKPEDAFAHLEKQAVQKQTFASKTERLTELTELSDRLHADPYAISQRLRRNFRQEKKMENALQQRDIDLKEKYGLGQRIQLDRQDPASSEKEKESWRRIKDRHPPQTASTATVPDLARVVKQNTLKRYDPFDPTNREASETVRAATRGGVSGSLGFGVKTKGKGKAIAPSEDRVPMTAGRKRRRLLEDEAEEEHQSAVDEGARCAGSLAPVDDSPIPLSKTMDSTPSETKSESAETTIKPTSGLVAYGSDSEADSS